MAVSPDWLKLDQGLAHSWVSLTATNFKYGGHEACHKGGMARSVFC